LRGWEEATLRGTPQPRNPATYDSIPGVSGIRLLIGIVVMGVLLPIMLFLLLNLSTPMQLFTLSASTLLTWGVVDLFSTILERPRLKGRSPQQALKDDWERRSSE
jgi:hypothetical protein